MALILCLTSGSHINHNAGLQELLCGSTDHGSSCRQRGGRNHRWPCGTSSQESPQQEGRCQAPDKQHEKQHSHQSQRQHPFCCTGTQLYVLSVCPDHIYTAEC
ncbi:hypothetical protein XENOCAPTIV_013407 [Xenoophorus captivus]|uniref:Uncharacterized protein n=1 Tax=Xenoophorus captivus TaxID=1517983 RepID=A0ABV0R4Y5_9TELE